MQSFRGFAMVRRRVLPAMGPQKRLAQACVQQGYRRMLVLGEVARQGAAKFAGKQREVGCECSPAVVR